MKTCCLKCKKDTDNIDLRMFKKKITYAIPNVVFVGLKSQDL